MKFFVVAQIKHLTEQLLCPLCLVRPLKFFLVPPMAKNMYLKFSGTTVI